MSESDAKNPAGASRGRPRDARIDQDVLRETLRELRINGLRNLSITSIAERAGVAKATVYLRWPDRRKLILDALLSTSNLVARPETGDLRTDLRLIIKQWGEIYRDPDLAPVFDRLNAERGDFAEISEIYHKKAAMPANRMIEEVILAARERGEVRADINAKVAARAIVGALAIQARLERRVTPHFERHLLDFIYGALKTDCASPDNETGSRAPHDSQQKMNPGL